MTSISKKRRSAIGYYPKHLAKITLPHRDPGTNQYSRINGKEKLVMFTDADVGLPYGVIPRLFLIWMTTQAIKNKSREITIDGSLSAFVRSIGLNSNGRDIKRFRYQAYKLFYASFTLTTNNKEDILHLEPAHKASFPENGNVNPRISLHESFFNNGLKKVIPIDLNAIRALKNSSLGIDIYIWLTFRMSYLKTPKLIPWDILQGQLGSDYKNDFTGRQGFKRAFDKQMMKIFKIYDRLKIKKTTEGILLEPSKPHVDKSCRQKVIHDHFVYGKV